MAVGENPLVVLWLDVDVLDTFHLLQTGHVDLVVEVAEVAQPFSGTPALAFFAAMLSAVMMLKLPVVVMKRSAVATKSLSYGPRSSVFDSTVAS